MQDTNSNNPKGRFIVIEGPEGSGKTSLAFSLKNYLQVRGIDVIQSKEPGTAFEGKLRSILLESNPSNVSELFLFLADRAEHVNKTIVPALNAGKWIILDRFNDSTMIYQSVAKNTVSKETCNQLCNLASQGCVPHLKLLLLADFDVCQKRLQEREDKLRRVAQQAGTTVESNIHLAYQGLRQDRSFIPIDANFSPNNVFLQAVVAIENLIKN